MPAITVFAGSLLVSAASPVVAVFGLAMVMYGVAQAIESPTVNAYVADIATPDQRPVALATMRTFGDVGLVIGAPLLGPDRRCHGAVLGPGGERRDCVGVRGCRSC